MTEGIYVDGNALSTATTLSRATTPATNSTTTSATATASTLVNVTALGLSLSNTLAIALASSHSIATTEVTYGNGTPLSTATDLLNATVLANNNNTAAATGSALVTLYRYLSSYQ